MTVFLEGAKPVEVVAIPRAAVLADQQGSYVYVIGPGNKAELRRVQLGQSSTTLAAVTTGLDVGEQVIAEGLQRVRAGEAVSPRPADAVLQKMMRDSSVTDSGAETARATTPAASTALPAGQAPAGTAGGAGSNASGSPRSRH